MVAEGHGLRRPDPGRRHHSLAEDGNVHFLLLPAKLIATAGLLDTDTVDIVHRLNVGIKRVIENANYDHENDRVENERIYLREDIGFAEETVSCRFTKGFLKWPLTG